MGDNAMADATSGRVSFLEIGAFGDAGPARAFFAAVFGWPLHDESWFQTPDLKAGTHGEDPAPQIYVYFNVPDLEAAAARVRAVGGEADDPTDEPGFGRFISCTAPGGVRFGLHQP
jgi:hypothetical protein